MGITAFHLSKKTGTYADALAALGLARMLYLLSARHPKVSDEGWAFVISWPGTAGIELSELDYGSLKADPGYRYLAKTLSDVGALHPAACIVYEEERRRLKNYRERRKELLRARSNQLTEEDRGELRQIAPMQGWFLYQSLNMLQAFGGYNQLHSAVRQCAPDVFNKSVMAKLRALAEGDDPATVSTPFAPKLSSVQALNPSVGKGVNRPKPDGTGAAGLPSFFVDWFEEWLRYLGVSSAANGYILQQNRKVAAIKLVTIAPQDLEGSAVASLWRDFVSLPLPWASIQIDVLASLGLARTLVVRSGLLDAPDPDPFSIFSRTPRDVVAGIQSAYFSNLGSAYALTNTSFIGLPGWFRVTDAATAGAWVSILDEHRQVVRGLDEEKSDEAAMLLRYRDFLSAGSEDITALLDFWAMYACHILRRGGKSRVPLFTIQNIGRLLMNTADQYSDIVRSEGFRGVAAAIRRATVSEQFQKAKPGGKQEYEIHYGLFQDLRQKAQFKDQVVSLLSGFVSSYNYENARRAEHWAKSGRGPDPRRRPQVTQQQLDDLVGLLDRFGPEPVTMLLIAYGSARDARLRDAKGDAVSGSDVAEETRPEAIAESNEDEPDVDEN